MVLFFILKNITKQPSKTDLISKIYFSFFFFQLLPQLVICYPHVELFFHFSLMATSNSASFTGIVLTEECHSHSDTQQCGHICKFQGQFSSEVYLFLMEICINKTVKLENLWST